ncbi:MAG: LacI family transcriptional regulator [Actinobacteria bacterium HGW-Actinobacteria-4]|nr:MAG: LacI family transcriptional regulator [Actinobacteria bacterium HGW-Actinobacteria-4]
MTSIEKVAELAGVSTATVSRALAGKPTVAAATRARVLEAAQELGYVVSASASSLASGKTRNVGVVMPFLNRWFFGSVLKGAHRTLADAGYDLTLYHLDSEREGGATEPGDPRRTRLFEEFLQRKRVDALIAVSLEMNDAELESLRRIGKPLVGLGGPLSGVPTLSIDDVAVAKLATEHLVSLGHTRIAHVSGTSTYARDFHLPAHRREGYETALREANITADPRLVRSADFTIAGGYAVTRQLLGDPEVRATAIFAASDEMAFGAMIAARDVGRRVPEDLSVIGIDGHELCEFFGLTTIDQFPEIQGERAASTLLRELEPHTQHHAPENVSLPYELAVRKSTAVAASPA